jgi:GTP-binding protein Era
MSSTTDKYENFKSGYVAIVGAPNAGKSTLLNRMLGEKISITSKKPQTTRNRILGVVHRPDVQIIFIDTPGIFKATDTLNLRIVDTAISAIGDADMILFVLDAANPDPTSEYFLAKRLQNQERPVTVALNKIDLIEKTDLLALIKKWSTEYRFDVIVPVSAAEGTQIEALIEAMENFLPQGPPYFPEDALTDLPERFIAAEMHLKKKKTASWLKLRLPFTSSGAPRKASSSAKKAASLNASAPNREKKSSTCSTPKFF